MFGFAYAQLPTQDPYPNTPAVAVNINQYAIYIDSISSLNEQLKPFAATNNNTAPPSAISLAGVQSGVHQLYIKVIATDGKPSIFAIGNFYMEGNNLYQNAPSPATNINQYAFYIDTVNNANEQVRPFTATNNNAVAPTPISLTGVLPGVHQLYGKVLATDRKPSIVNFGNFYIEGDNRYQNPPPAATNINQYSFYIDSVSNVNEQLKPFAATNNNTVAPTPINLTGVTSGVHQLYAKVTSSDGKPSIFNLGNFYMNGDNLYQNTPAAAANINRYEFYIDSVTSINSQPVSFTAGLTNVSPNVNVDLTAVLPGVHQMYARVFDVNNKPSIVNLGSFLMDQIFRYQNAPTAAPTVSTMEYFIDTDPGFGNATPVTFTAAADIANLSISATGTSSLNSGPHYFYIRSKQNPWSSTAVVPFTVNAPLPLTWRYIMAQLQDKTGVVKWGTATEINTKEFVVEHSTDGRTFSPLGTQAAAGNSSTVKNYLYNHNNLAIGLNYYRIKQIDNDGRFTYSAIVTLLNKNGMQQALLAPNPAANYSLLIFGKPTYKTTVSIFNVAGQLVKSIKVGDGQTQQQIDVSDLAKGKYSLRLVGADGAETLTLLKL